MTTVTLWILILMPNGTRAGATVDRFLTQEDCKAAAARIEVAARWGGAFPACIEAKVAR